ncbi:MAG: DUF805 domain-containing protein [Alphaproteobacteria bacterium]|nr:DUF805 domain-containing protein [Alphaproteobacteria bacterium]
MKFRTAIAVCFSKYIVFEGRACRSEFWYWALFVNVVAVVTWNIDLLIFSEGWVGILTLLFSFAVFLPGLAVSIRRLHDIDKSGWWFLLGFILIIGTIILIIWAIRKGDETTNRFGADPLAKGSA